MDLADQLLRAIEAGELAPGATLPSVRALARREATTPTTVARAYGELARTGVIVTEPRRPAVVATDAPAIARRRLRHAAPLRLAGSDDPLLDELAAAAGTDVDRLPAGGSFAGLTALWRGDADAATLHLWHRSGEHNAPYAARVLAGREPRLVRLWSREQGLVVPADNPRGVGRVADLAGLVVARRRAGTGTQVLLDRLVQDEGGDPGGIRGPEMGSHFEVALAVASGTADAGMAVRAVATALGLDFVPLAWEPFDLALGAEAVERSDTLIDGLSSARLAARAQELGGYDFADSGRILEIR